jgi:hypothetical protein
MGLPVSLAIGENVADLESTDIMNQEVASSLEQNDQSGNSSIMSDRQ